MISIVEIRKTLSLMISGPGDMFKAHFLHPESSGVQASPSNPLLHFLRGFKLTSPPKRNQMFQNKMNNGNSCSQVTQQGPNPSISAPKVEITWSTAAKDSLTSARCSLALSTNIHWCPRRYMYTICWTIYSHNRIARNPRVSSDLLGFQWKWKG